MHYRHTQTGPLHWGIAGVALALGVASYFMWTIPVAGPVMAGSAGLVAILSLGFHSLTVEDTGDAIELRYGPLPFFGKRIAYATIVGVEPGRSSLIDGLGVHWVPGRGWTYNLWGCDCVVLTLQNGQTIRVGTDDRDGLTSFLLGVTAMDGPVETAGV